MTVSTGGMVAIAILLWVAGLIPGFVLGAFSAVRYVIVKGRQWAALQEAMEKASERASDPNAR